MAKKPGTSSLYPAGALPVFNVDSWTGSGIDSVATKAVLSRNWLPTIPPHDYRHEPYRYAFFESTLATTSPTLSTFITAGSWVDTGSFETVRVACTIRASDGADHSTHYGLFRLYGGHTTAGAGTYTYDDPPLQYPTEATNGFFPILRWDSAATGADYDHFPVSGPASMSATRVYDLSGIPWIYPAVSHNSASQSTTFDVTINFYFRSIYEEG